MPATLASFSFTASGTEQHKIFKDKHQVPDGFDKRWMALLHTLQNLLAGSGIQTVEHLRYGPHTANASRLNFPRAFSF